MLVRKRGDRWAVEFLIQHGADVNGCKRYTTETALSLSLRQKDMIQLLLRNGADPWVDGPRFRPQHEGTGTDGDSIQTALEDAVCSGYIKTT